MAASDLGRFVLSQRMRGMSHEDISAHAVYGDSGPSGSTAMPPPGTRRAGGSTSRVISSNRVDYSAAKVSTRTPTQSRGRPRTVATRGEADTDDIICALSESRGVTPTVGLAVVNISTSDAILSQICDTQFFVETLCKIQAFSPSTILIVSSACAPNSRHNLSQKLGQANLEAELVSLSRQHWSESAGIEYIEKLSFREDLESIRVATNGSFYAITSFAAAMTYLENEHQIMASPHSLRIRYEPPEETMMIDPATLQSLELLQNNNNPTSKDCLFGLLSQTLTPMGSRLLRSSILQPSTVIDRIDKRLDAVEELSSKEDMFFAVRKALKSLCDVEKIVTRLVIFRKEDEGTLHNEEQALNWILQIKDFLKNTSNIYESLVGARCDVLMRIRDFCRDELTLPILDSLGEFVNDDATYAKAPLEMSHQRMYAIKATANQFLEYSRRDLRDLTNKVHDHVTEINTSFNLIGVLKYDQSRYYYLKFRESDFDQEIPHVLISPTRSRGFIECQTMGLRKLNSRLVTIQNSILQSVEDCVKSLIEILQSKASVLFKISESIAQLDTIAAFAHLATCREYQRPIIANELALEGARHPILDKKSPGKIVPNNVFVSDSSRFQIITGCNMSGKSTYLRMVALQQIMAQIGCYVPAKFATFPMIRKLFARVTTDDVAEANMSTFSLEMREMAFIMGNTDHETLLIIDELGRGTSTREGLGLALALSEALIQTHAKVLFATHFVEMADVLADRTGVGTWHLETQVTPIDERQSKMTMLYTISEGPLKDEGYGLHLARVMGFPPQFLDSAERMRGLLKAKYASEEIRGDATRLAKRRKYLLQLKDILRAAEKSPMDAGALKSSLLQVQRKFVDFLAVPVAQEDSQDMDIDEVQLVELND